MISLSQAFANWESEIKPDVIARFGENDAPALAESWNDYTDALAKDGELHALQYHFCPAWDDEMPGEGSRFDPLAADREFILDSMGLAVTAEKADTRPGADEWSAGSTHWRVTLRRRGKSMRVWYSMGSALTGSPDACDVLNCLLRDADGASESFADWCAEYDYDPDSRKAERTWKACKRTAAALDRLFSGSELADLRELFEDM